MSWISNLVDRVVDVIDTAKEAYEQVMEYFQRHNIPTHDTDYKSYDIPEPDMPKIIIDTSIDWDNLPSDLIDSLTYGVFGNIFDYKY